MARDCGTFKKVEEKSLINRKNAGERGVQKEKYKKKTLVCHNAYISQGSRQRGSESSVK